MKSIQRWLEVAMVSVLVIIIIYDFVQHQRFASVLLPFLLLMTLVVFSWLTDQRLAVKKPIPRLRLLLRTVGLILGFLAAFGYVLLINGGQVMMALLLALTLLGAVGTVIVSFAAINYDWKRGSPNEFNQKSR